MINTKYGRALEGISSVYSREMDGFIGTDISADPSTISARRLAYCINMWRDYESENGGAVETIPGWRRIFGSGEERKAVYGLFCFRGMSGEEYLVVHRGEHLYRIPVGELDSGKSLSDYTVASDMALSKSTFFDDGGQCYVLDGSKYRCLGETGDAERVTVSAYVPTTYIEREPYEQRNMLTNDFIERFRVRDGVRNKMNTDIWRYSRYLQEGTKEYAMKIVGLNKSAEEIMYAYIPQYVKYGNDILEVKAVEQSVYDELIHLEQLVVDAPISIGQFSLGKMTSLRRLVLRNSLSNFAFNACDSITETAQGTFVGSVVPLEELWLRNSGIEYRNDATSDQSDVMDGICSMMDTVTVYTASRAPVFVTAGGGTWTPRKAVCVTGVEFLQVAVGDTIEYDCKIGFQIYNENALRIEHRAEKKKCTVYFLSDFAFSHTCYSIDRTVYCAQVYDKETGETGAESGCWFTYDLMERFESISSVRVSSGGERRFEGKPGSGNVSVLINAVDLDRSIDIHAKGVEGAFNAVGNLSDIYSGSGTDAPIADAVEKCTVTCSFDGRVFFTGNPDLPNTVFYSGQSITGKNDPSYVGIYNYFNDGIGSVPNTAMVSNASVLAVFKGAALSGASAYYHTAQNNADQDTMDILPRVYPSTEGMTGVPCVGAACNFADDTVFVSPNGLEGVGKRALNLERTLTHRSGRVDPLLRMYISGGVQLAEWKGYLCLLAEDGRMFLADSRAMTVNESTGETQYEWFLMDGVGSYSDDSARYEYFSGGVSVIGEDGKQRTVIIGDGTALDLGNGGISGLPDLNGMQMLNTGVGEVGTASTVYSFPYLYENGERSMLADGGELMAVYVPEEGFCAVVQSDERMGGEFCPAQVLMEYGGRLFFGTENGDVCVFNTDKRGKDEGIGADEIHSRWYDRCGHRYHSGMATLSDNCGYPQFAKSTVGKTLTVKAKRMNNSAITLSAKSDREDWKYIQDFTLSENSFYRTDFSNLSFEDGPRTILASQEKMKRWCEKQLYLFSDGFRRPFGVYGLAYCYTLAGRVRGR